LLAKEANRGGYEQHRGQPFEPERERPGMHRRGM
jgi:hypothetical protein